MKRQDEHRSSPGFWDLFTSFILSATVGMMLFNFIRVISLHNASLDAGRHVAGSQVRKADLALQVGTHAATGKPWLCSNTTVRRR